MRPAVVGEPDVICLNDDAGNNEKADNEGCFLRHGRGCGRRSRPCVLPVGFNGLILASWGLTSIAIILAMQWRTRCPHCHTLLGAKRRASTKDSPTIDNCPYCSVNFDQPTESVARTE